MNGMTLRLESKDIITRNRKGTQNYRQSNFDFTPTRKNHIMCKFAQVQVSCCFFLSSLISNRSKIHPKLRQSGLQDNCCNSIRQGETQKKQTNSKSQTGKKLKLKTRNIFLLGNGSCGAFEHVI